MIDIDSVGQREMRVLARRLQAYAAELQDEPQRQFDLHMSAELSKHLARLTAKRVRPAEVPLHSGRRPSKPVQAAERRLGEMMASQKERFGTAQGTRSDLGFEKTKVEALAKVGIDKSSRTRARKAAVIISEYQAARSMSAPAPMATKPLFVAAPHIGEGRYCQFPGAPAGPSCWSATHGGKRNCPPLPRNSCSTRSIACLPTSRCCIRRTPTCAWRTKNCTSALTITIGSNRARPRRKHRSQSKARQRAARQVSQTPPLAKAELSPCTGRSVGPAFCPPGADYGAGEASGLPFSTM
jgi:hypothetical protein